MTNVADFLLQRFQEGIGPSALQVYRSAINSVWAFQGRSLNDAFEITALLKSFSAEKPRKINTFPRWDLSLILRALVEPPYEPLTAASPLHLTQKAVFLLLLASARRVGDIHALDPRRMVIKDRALILQPHALYIPKVASTAEGEKWYSPIVVRRLSNLATDEEDLKLCPVRALLAYDKYAKKLSKDRSFFFLSLQAPHHPVKKQTISSWAVRLIKDVYASATDTDLRITGVKAHEIRAISTSLALQATHALSSVIATATWKSHSTFTSFYLKDMSGQQENLHTIGPCVVAGHTLH